MKYALAVYARKLCQIGNVNSDTTIIKIGNFVKF